MARSIVMLALFVLTLSPAVADWPAFLGGTGRSSIAGEFPLEWSRDSGVTWAADLPGHGQSSPIQVGEVVYVTAIEGPNKETNLVLAFDLKSGKQLWQHRSVSSLTTKNDLYTSRAAPTPVADSDGVYAFFESGNLIALDPAGEVRWQRSLIDDYGKYVGRFGLGGSPAQLDDRIFVLADNDGPSYLLAVDKKSGETIWKSDRASRTAWSSPMIVSVDGQPQIVVSSSGSIDGYDPGSGEQLWSFDDVGGNTVASPLPFGDGKFLVGASPGQNGEHAEGAKQSNMAVQIVKDGDRYSPKVLWRNQQATSSFGSPIVHDGHAYYTNRAGVLFCIDAETGETAYTARVGDSNWATPVGLADRVYIFGKSGKTIVMSSGDTDKKLAENQLWESTAGGGPGGFGGEIQYGVALTDAGFVVRTGTRLFLIGG
jgi:outer membrane protein assembly factor BamB